MNKKLDETLNLRSMDEINELEKLSEELDSVDPSDFTEEDEHISEHVKEMNDVFEMALKSHRETLDLGYTVDTKYAGGIIATSAKFLDIAISASSSKIEKRLRKKKLELEAQLTKSKTQIQASTTVNGQEIIVDEPQEGELLMRNDVMKRIQAVLDEKKENSEKSKKSKKPK